MSELGGSPAPRRKVRSPSYPFIDLRTAIERARRLFEAEQRNAVHQETAAAHWGYSPKSSGGKQTIAALRAFGLLEGDGMVKLTERAVRILFDERNPSPERDLLLRQAALSPALHGRLWEKYGAVLPSSTDLRLSLILGEGFNENSVDEFIEEYAETLTFARLRPPDSSVQGSEQPALALESAPRKQLEPERDPAPSASDGPRTAAIGVDPAIFPLLDGNAIELRIRRKISPDEVKDVRDIFEICLRKILSP
ncbi:MAG TPA: hypothetical protein VIA62_12125 [Thermoanaerobaculia bacterium]|jgi:hypothetical protein|nr:hypothetical protein [Thermoanaerobaculia bacterium]